jgi:hypothetical protein
MDRVREKIPSVRRVLLRIVSLSLLTRCAESMNCSRAYYCSLWCSLLGCHPLTPFSRSDLGFPVGEGIYLSEAKFRGFIDLSSYTL